MISQAADVADRSGDRGPRPLTTSPTTGQVASTAGVTGLTFQRTVDRSLLHRTALSEVFLTDCRIVDDHTYLAAAQLPPSHAYYTDHQHRSPLIDPILLLECARQAETYGGHAVFGVPAHTRFILRDWSLHIDDVAALARTVGPVEMSMVVHTGEDRWVGGSLRGLVYGIDILLDGRHAGRARISVSYLPEETYHHLRRGRRGSPPPSSTSISTVFAGTPVPPHLVGRSNADNVVLQDARVEGAGIAACVRLALDNASMFDHTQDHLPGMVMTEAARQAGLLVLNDLHGLSPFRWVLTSVRASFAAYAELDATTLVRARPHLPADPLGVWELTVEFEQDLNVVAEAVLTMTLSG